MFSSYGLSLHFCSAFQVDVIVDLKPLKNDGVVIRDVTLLLKCVKSVNWVVKTHNVMGKLDVVVSWQQNTERDFIYFIQLFNATLWFRNQNRNKFPPFEQLHNELTSHASQVQRSCKIFGSYL